MEKLSETLEPVLNVDEIIELEKKLDSEGITLRELMEHAGSALTDAIKLYASASAKNVCVLAGSGNNGGDGWVAAKLLAQGGAHVTLVSKCTAQEITAQPAHDAACETQAAIDNEELSILVYIDPSEEELDNILQHADAIIDAILGTGFTGDEVRAPYDMWIRLANEARARGTWVYAADVPSGLNAQTGTAAHPTVEADKTITMLAAKPGIVADKARQFTGTVLLAPLVEA